MRISLAISVLILAAMAGLGWHDHQRLVVLRGDHAKLAAEAESLGISLPSGNSGGRVRVTKHERENREAIAKLFAADLVDYIRDVEARGKMDGPSPEAAQQRLMDVMDRLVSLDPAQVKVLIAELRASKDLKDDTRRGLIGFAIMTLAKDHPQAALGLFAESSDLLDGGMGKHIISSSLARWAKDDPPGALDWVRKNGEKFPGLVTESAKYDLISGAAANDPKAAFQLIGELGIKDASRSIDGILEAAKTPEQRTATLVALREYVATLPDEKARTITAGNSMGGLARGLAKEGFVAATRWLTGANLTEDELVGIAGHLGPVAKGGEAGQWIEWIGARLPPEKSANSIQAMVREWTRNDYQAAGKWLASAPAGPARNASIRAYVETISRYEPETAVQWAMTLPAGDDRAATLKQIHEDWPESDAAGKEAFAKQHGFK